MARRILIIDDEEIDRQLLSAMLSDEYTVIEATNGREALGVLRESAKSISAILLDIIMPDMDGYEVLRKIRANALWSQIPVIISTGLTDQEMQSRSLLLGAYGIISKPFNPSLIHSFLRNSIRLRETASIVNGLRKDKLTGLSNREAFFLDAAGLIASHPAGYYILACFDIDSFKVINDQYGTEKGDFVLQHVADCINGCAGAAKGICCRLTADKFAMLFPASYKESDIMNQASKLAQRPPCIGHSIRIRVGRYTVDDLTLPVSAMYDRAALAQESIRGRYDISVMEYDESMRISLLNEQQIVNVMYDALREGQFIPWYQPQYDHSTGAIIGAEALVRWKRPGYEGFVPPGEFIPIFERNGFIYEMDKRIWEEVCRTLRYQLSKGGDPLPVSVNVSRHDIFHKHFIDTVVGLVEKYQLPKKLLHLEITESAFTKAPEQIVATVKRLTELGFTVEIDDFGSGYSSLNTLKDVPADVLKLDMRFLSDNGGSERGGIILESIVRMAKWLDMSIIAEGVETKDQADYLKSVGCHYIQGYYYARPMPLEEYEQLLRDSLTEKTEHELETVETFDSSAFWDPKSMDTLIFNSYVGGASIFEYRDGKAETLRYNERFRNEWGDRYLGGVHVSELDPERVLDAENYAALNENVKIALRTQKESTCEVCTVPLAGGDGKPIYLRCTCRVLAKNGDRYLLYNVLMNITSMRVAELNERLVSERIHAIMDNADFGLTAVIVNDKSSVECLFSNDKYYKLIGYSRSQYAAEVKNVFELVIPEDREAVINAVCGLNTVGDGKTIVFRAKRRDGKIIWLRNVISVIAFDNIDRPIQLSNFIDITAEKEAEQAEHRTETKLQTIMDKIGSGISAAVIHSDRTEFLFANNRYFELLGYTEEEFRRNNCNIYYSIHPDDRAQLKARVEAASRDRVSTVAEFRTVYHDGRVAWLRGSITIADFLGIEEPVQLAVFEDITAERDAGEQIAFFENITNELISNSDENAGINEMLGKILRYSDANRAYIFEFDHEKNTAANTYEVCASGVSREIDNLQDIPLETMHFWVHAFDKREYISISDVSALGDDRAVEREVLLSQGIKSLIASPLYRDGTLIGFIGVDDPCEKRVGAKQLTTIGSYLIAMLIRRDLRKTAESVLK